MPNRRICLSGLASVLVLLAANAGAQSIEGLDFERFKPSLDSKGLVLTEAGEGEEAWDFNLGILFSYSNDPMVFTLEGKVVRELVSDRFHANLYGSFAFTDWFSLGLDLPVVLYQNGIMPEYGTAIDLGLSSASFMDIRLTPKFTVLREKKFPLAMALVIPVSLPSGDKYEFTGSREDSLTVAPTLALSRHFANDKLLLAMNLGVWLRKGETFLNLQTGHQFLYRLGLAYQVTDMVMPFTEMQGASELDGLFSNDPAQVHMEWLLGCRLDLAMGFRMQGGFGLPLQGGWGTPDFRLFMGISWSPESVQVRDSDEDGVADEHDRCIDQKGPRENEGCPWGDKDADGVINPQDKCPKEAGLEENHGCPWPDKDKDGVADREDACPDKPGTPERKGCPEEKPAEADTDGDGMVDSKDKCPEIAGPTENEGCPWADTDGDGLKDNEDKCKDEKGPTENEGCPWPDADGDGILDKDDACVDVPEDGKGKKPKDGCPVKIMVVVEKKEIKITEKVYFKTGRSSIQVRSIPLLQQVSQALNAHPEITKLRVEGHTDSVGSASGNQKLSERRAESVMQFLVTQGVDSTRLESKGYGESFPVASNKTPRGREANRRVVFKILDKN